MVELKFVPLHFLASTDEVDTQFLRLLIMSITTSICSAMNSFHIDETIRGISAVQQPHCGFSHSRFARKRGSDLMNGGLVCTNHRLPVEAYPHISEELMMTS
jgi:hypothetical protein